MEEYKVGYKKPPISGQIKKGEVRNPLGQKAHTNTIHKEIRKLSQKEIEQVCDLILFGDPTQLRDIVANKDTSGDSVLKVWVASCAYKAMLKGDIGALLSLVDRLLGKVINKLELTGKDGGAIDFSPEDPEERKKRIEENIKKLEILNA